MNPDEELNCLKHIYCNRHQHYGIECNNAHSFYNDLLTQGPDCKKATCEDTPWGSGVGAPDGAPW